jgi:hypothetical protein
VPPCEVVLGRPQPDGDRRLERPAVDEGEELLGGADGATSGAGPQIQPIFQPVTLNVLPALLTRGSRSRMPGSVAMDVPAPSKTRCS